MPPQKATIQPFAEKLEANFSLLNKYLIVKKISFRDSPVD
jgi:hypothetical protein